MSKLPNFVPSKLVAIFLGLSLAFAAAEGPFDFLGVNLAHARDPIAAPESPEQAEHEAAVERKRRVTELCPAELHSDDPNFERLRRNCDFNRKKLPRCPEGVAALDPYGGSVFATGQRRLNPRRRECTKEWTIITFLAMDNDLNEFGEEDLAEIAWGKTYDTQNKVDIVVEADFAVRTGKRYVFEKSADGERPETAVVKDFYGNEQNTGDPRTLEDFVAWAVEYFPARNYLLIMGGHGDGWAATVRPKIRLAPAPAPAPGPVTTAALDSGAGDPGRFGNGIALDTATGVPGLAKDWLSVSDLRRVLSRISQRLMGGDPFDVYAADACFMQQAEVAFELRKQARFLYGSIPVMAYQGLPYATLIQNFVDGKYPDALTLASDLPRLMVDSYRGKNEKVYASTVESEPLETDLAAALLKIGRAGQTWIESSPDRLMDNFLVTSAISDAITHQTSVVELSDFLDKLLGQLLASAQPGAPARPGLLEFLEGVRLAREALSRSVISSAWGAHYEPMKDRMAGLSIWMPAGRPAYRNFQEHLQRSNLHRFQCDCEQDHEKPNDWGLFLRAIFAPTNP